MEASNVKAMRDALVKIEKKAHCDLCNVYPKYRDKFNDIIGGIEHEARAALAEPPRNCDIGTAEEQRRRYDEWRNHDGLRAALGKDEFEWAQLPYESEVAK